MYGLRYNPGCGNVAGVFAVMYPEKLPVAGSVGLYKPDNKPYLYRKDVL